MEKAYKYRIYPNKKQAEFIQKTFGCARFVYNHYLAIRIEKYKRGRNYRVGLWRTHKTSLHDGKFYETRITWLQPCDVQ